MVPFKNSLSRIDLTRLEFCSELNVQAQWGEVGNFIINRCKIFINTETLLQNLS